MTAGLGEPVSDTELAARFQRDPEMFTVVYDRYARDIFRYVGSRLGAQAADDIAAETFLVAFGQRDRFDPSRGSWRPWLFGIATNLVARHRRKEARHYMALARIGAEPPPEGLENRWGERESCWPRPSAPPRSHPAPTGTSPSRPRWRVRARPTRSGSPVT